MTIEEYITERLKTLEKDNYSLLKQVDDLEADFENATDCSAVKGEIIKSLVETFGLCWEEAPGYDESVYLYGGKGDHYLGYKPLAEVSNLIRAAGIPKREKPTPTPTNK